MKNGHSHNPEFDERVAGMRKHLLETVETAPPEILVVLYHAQKALVLAMAVSVGISADTEAMNIVRGFNEAMRSKP